MQRKERISTWLDRVMQDVRFGARMLARTPGFTILAVLCLAAAIGSNAAVLSLVESILVRPYPGVADQERLVAVASTTRGASGYSDMSWPDFTDLAHTRAFSAVIAAKIVGATITGGDRAERVAGQLVSANYFGALGVRPVLGRGFTPDEEIGANGHPVTVISYRMWQDRFAGDGRVIGKLITFNRVPHTIIGVAPEAFAGTFVGYSMQFWVPASMQAVFNGKYMLNDRSARWIEGFARLAPGVDIAQAQSAVSVTAKQLELQYPDVDRGRGVRVLSLWDAPFDNAKELLPMIRVAFLVVVFVLLIACANVANLFLVRSFARRNEMTARLALGASRGQLVRQLGIEGALLALLATTVGLLLAYWSRGALVLFFAPRGGVNLHFAITLDWRVLAFGALVGIGSTLLFALVPAIRSSRIDLASALKSDSRASAGGVSGTHLRGSLVVLQVAMSLVLLIGAGLLVESLQRVRHADPGFRIDGVVTTPVGLLSAGYDTSRARLFADQLVDRLRATGAIESVALARSRPFDPSGPYAVAPIATDLYHAAKDEQPAAAYNAVSPDYFATLGIPLIRGRDFTRFDDDTTAAVSIVSEAMAARYWPGSDPVGKRLQVRDRWTRVVGVVKDIKYESLLRPTAPLFYVPMRQAMSTSFILQARTRDGTATFRAAYERALHELDPNVVPYETLSMREQLARSLSTQRLASTLLGVFASVALALAALGLYGVMSYVVSQSTRELGLRMALGAQQRTVLALVLSRGLRLTGVGVVIGVAVALGTTRLLGDLLYKVDPRDPVVFACGLAIMVIATVIACVFPAWRAARTDLVRALRV